MLNSIIDQNEMPKVFYGLKLLSLAIALELDEFVASLQQNGSQFIQK